MIKSIELLNYLQHLGLTEMVHLKMKLHHVHVLMPSKMHEFLEVNTSKILENKKNRYIHNTGFYECITFSDLEITLIFSPRAVETLGFQRLKEEMIVGINN